MAFVAAALQEARDRKLGQRGTCRGLCELESLHLLLKAARSDKAHAVAGRQRLGERRTEQHQTVLIPGLGGLGSRRPKVEVAVDVVFDERYVAAGEHADELDLGVVGHQTAERGVEVGSHNAGTNPKAAKGCLEGVEVEAAPWMQRNFHHAQAHAFDQLKRAVKGGRPGEVAEEFVALHGQDEPHHHGQGVRQQKATQNHHGARGLKWRARSSSPELPTACLQLP